MKKRAAGDMPTFNHFRLGYRPALDGLRALSILTIVATHAVYVWNPEDSGRFLPGGFIGVDLFFAISGFLITSLLLTETSRNGRISLKRFYQRRAFRLLPALYAMLVVQFIYTLIVGDPVWHDVKGLFLIVMYVSNWAIVFHWAQPFGTLQTWSLGVEEQFYLVWPLLLMVLVRFHHRSRAIAVFFGLIFIAFISRAYLWHTGRIGWNLIYVQTESRLDVLMCGALLAYLLHTGWKPPSWSPLVGQVSLAFLVVFVAKTYATEAWLYHGGFTIVAFAAAAVVLLALDGQTRIARMLSWGPVTAIGRRSYSLYVWHFLIFLAVSRAIPHVDHLERLACALVLTALATEFSHRVVERPFLVAKEKLSVDPLPIPE